MACSSSGVGKSGTESLCIRGELLDGGCREAMAPCPTFGSGASCELHLDDSQGSSRGHPAGSGCAGDIVLGGARCV